MNHSTSKLTTSIALGVCVLLAAPRGAAQTPPLVPSQPLIDGNGATITWSGGTGPYLLQRKYSLADAAWMNVTTTAQFRAVIPIDSDSAFYRLVNRATNMVAAQSAWLTGDAVRPAPLTNSASGFGSFIVDGNKLTYKITYTGLSGSPTAAQIHGPASTSQSVVALYSIGPITNGTAGTLTGQMTLGGFGGFGDAAFLSASFMYVEIDTSAHPNGELRGQIAAIQYTADLRGTNEVPAVQTAGSGSGQFTLIGNQLAYDVDYTNLASSSTAVQIYGPASLTHSTNVMQTLTGPGGPAGKLTGKLTLTPAQLGALIDGFTYMNIHTAGHGAGEIRGQIVRLGSGTARGTQ